MLSDPEPRLFQRWTEDDDFRLRTMLSEGLKLPAIATALGRTKAATAARQKKLGLRLRKRD